MIFSHDYSSYSFKRKVFIFIGQIWPFAMTIADSGWKEMVAENFARYIERFISKHGLISIL